MIANNFLSKLKKQNASKWLMVLIIFVFLWLIIFGTANILSNNNYEAGNIYKAIGFIIIMLWTCVFVCYFVWAIYFYNLNLGITNSDWRKIYAAKENRTNGQPFNQQDIDEEPKYNPYKDETFGLPGGTVRGMIAFTLLFGAIAMLLASFGMSNEFKNGSFFYDQIEFFKTAFLMMIAFYFGSRTLQYLKSNPTVPVQLGSSGKTSIGSVETKSRTQNEPLKPEIVVIGEEKPSVPNGEIPPIVAIDPMNPKK